MKKTGNYQLIISDFDGTLLRSDGTVGERTVEDIRKFTKAGGIFAICTGRMLTSILPEARKIGLTGLVAAYQGSTIADIVTGEIVRNDGFDFDSALKVCLALEDTGANIHLYTIDTLFVNYRNEYLDFYEKVCSVKGERKEKLSDFLRESKVKVVKFVVMTNEERQKDTLKAMTELLGEEFYVTSSASILVEITPKTQTKASAVKYLANHYGVELSQVIALGDNLNDAPMVKIAGLGVAVANAHEDLKKVADEITSANDEDGVGKIIEKYALGGKL